MVLSSCDTDISDPIYVIVTNKTDNKDTLIVSGLYWWDYEIKYGESISGTLERGKLVTVRYKSNEKLTEEHFFTDNDEEWVIN